jgi:high-affinity iron transporter
MTSFIITLREIIEFSLIVLLLTSVYKDHSRTIISSAVIVIFTGALITFAYYPLTTYLEQTYSKAMIYSFLVILYLSLIANEKVIYPVLCIILACLFPSAQLTAVLISHAELMGVSAYIYSLMGMLTGILFFIVCSRYLPRLDLTRIFKAEGLMILISALCFLFGGLDEFDSTSVITSIQKGLHNVIPSPRLAMAVTALLLFIPPVYVFIRLLLEPEPATDNIEIKEEKRKMLAEYIVKLTRKGAPILIYLLVSIVMLHSANLAMNPLFDPEPIPVIVDGSEISIPLTDNRGDIYDGRIRKYSFRDRGKVYRFIVLMRPDSEVIAALDACEICPPTGYVQRGEHVICKYCSTPIPLQSLGQPGGCNPIPVSARKEGDTLVLDRDDIVQTHEKWLGDTSSHAGH